MQPFCPSLIFASKEQVFSVEEYSKLNALAQSTKVQTTLEKFCNFLVASSKILLVLSIPATSFDLMTTTTTCCTGWCCDSSSNEHSLPIRALMFWLQFWLQFLNIGPFFQSSCHSALQFEKKQLRNNAQSNKTFYCIFRLLDCQIFYWWQIFIV